VGVMPDRDVPRVLVVDDDVRVRHFLTTALGAAGFAVTATGTGEEGLRLAAARPDLVVLDVELPDLSGREVCRRLKGAEDTGTVHPVPRRTGAVTGVRAAPAAAQLARRHDADRHPGAAADLDGGHPHRYRHRADAPDARDHRGGGLPRGAIGAAAGGRPRTRR